VLAVLPAQPEPGALMAAAMMASHLVSPLPAPALPREAARTRSLRVLVADDNRVNRKVMRMILEREGHSVVLADDGDAALDALEAEAFDVVLMDVNMPGLDGIEATKLYRFAALGRPHVPIIGVTADATPAAAQRCREAGMDGCLIKPVEPEQLAEMVAYYARSGVPEELPQPATLPAKPSATAAPALDPEVTARLSALGGAEFTAQLLNDFLQDAEGILQRLKAAAQEGDAPQFRAAAHALRSSAANIGAHGVFEFCAAAEALPAPEIPASGLRQVEMLAAELQRVRAARPALV
jgi:two-component system sensor histidine kinase RpfC